MVACNLSQTRAYSLCEVVAIASRGAQSNGIKGRQQRETSCEAGTTHVPQPVAHYEQRSVSLVRLTEKTALSIPWTDCFRPDLALQFGRYSLVSTLCPSRNSATWSTVTPSSL